MQETGIYRPSYFFDVFDGFNYEEAISSPDAIWARTHVVDEGMDAVVKRLKRFERVALGRACPCAQEQYYHR
jgi:hypothetical protein